MFNEMTVLLQSYHQEELTTIAVKSFEKHKPKDLLIKYIVVEGSDDTNYKDNIMKISDNISWYNNIAADNNNPIAGASTANGLNIEFGKKFIETDWVFVCHNDVSVESKKFFEVLREESKNFSLISCCRDNGRIEACHISGLLVKNKILQEVDCMPLLPELDVGDRLTLYCRQNNLKYKSLPNTHNNPKLVETIKNEFWRNAGENCGVDRCVIDGDVIFCHLGRGTPKFLNAYRKQGKILHSDWCRIHK